MPRRAAPVASRAEAAARTEANALRVQGKATFRGHPIHLMLLPFPVAFWSGALATDVAAAFSHDAFYFRMSAVLVMMGTLGAIVASVAGYVDYRTAPMSAKARSVATGHMLWSLAALAAFAIAWYLRARVFGSPAGIAATSLGAVVLFVAGYLGSEVANRYRVGINEASLERAGAAASEPRAKRRR